MVVVFFSGEVFHPHAATAFAYSLPGETGCGIVDGAKEPSAEAAAWIALGKALALLIHTKTATGELKLIGDNPAVIAALRGKSEPESEWTRTLRDTVRERLKAIGLTTRVELIPREQNLICTQLCRAAYIGRFGAVPAQAQVRDKS